MSRKYEDIDQTQRKRLKKWISDCEGKIEEISLALDGDSDPKSKDIDLRKLRREYVAEVEALKVDLQAWHAENPEVLEWERWREGFYDDNGYNYTDILGRQITHYYPHQGGATHVVKI